jgi:hypothetical protein
MFKVFHKNTFIHPTILQGNFASYFVLFIKIKDHLDHNPLHTNPSHNFAKLCLSKLCIFFLIRKILFVLMFPHITFNPLYNFSFTLIPL